MLARLRANLDAISCGANSCAVGCVSADVRAEATMMNVVVNVRRGSMVQALALLGATVIAAATIVRLWR